MAGYPMHPPQEDYPFFADLSHRMEEEARRREISDIEDRALRYAEYRENGTNIDMFDGIDDPDSLMSYASLFIEVGFPSTQNNTPLLSACDEEDEKKAAIILNNHYGELTPHIRGQRKYGQEVLKLAVSLKLKTIPPLLITQGVCSAHYHSRYSELSHTARWLCRSSFLYAIYSKRHKSPYYECPKPSSSESLKKAYLKNPTAFWGNVIWEGNIPASEIDTPAVDPEVIKLLNDRRLVRAQATGLISSHLTGMVALFLPECCGDNTCPKEQAYQEMPSISLG